MYSFIKRPIEKHGIFKKIVKNRKERKIKKKIELSG